jgi:hypothetical protein
MIDRFIRRLSSKLKHVHHYQQDALTARCGLQDGGRATDTSQRFSFDEAGSKTKDWKLPVPDPN